jgi:uncharacterized protein YcaQ
MVQTLTGAQARRIALAAQGFGRRRTASPGTRQLNLEIERLGLLQIDSVNVFERSHYLPIFSRLGAYDKAALDRLTFGKHAKYAETWAHVASIVPLETWPLLRWSRDEYRARQSSKPDGWPLQNRQMLDWLLAELAAKGPLPASKIEHEANRGKGSWWGWSEVKTGLEYLFFWGDVVSAGRNNFERIYGLPQQVLPRPIIDAVVPKPDAIRELVLRASRALGIGTLSDIADYYRLRTDDTKAALHDLVDAGAIATVTVRGWDRGGRPLPVYLHQDARLPRRIETTSLLSPFDPIVWERDRALRMFGFHYRIEIYKPAPKRVFGYYTLPLLVDEALVGRIDLKNDRQNGVLRVQSAWSEGSAAFGHEPRVVAHLREIADWQGLGDIEVMGRGDLARSLAAELGQPVVEPAAIG